MLNELDLEQIRKIVSEELEEEHKFLNDEVFRTLFYLLLFIMMIVCATFLRIVHF